MNKYYRHPQQLTCQLQSIPESACTRWARGKTNPSQEAIPLTRATFFGTSASVAGELAWESRTIIYDGSVRSKLCVIRFIPRKRRGAHGCGKKSQKNTRSLKITSRWRRLSTFGVKNREEFVETSLK